MTRERGTGRAVAVIGLLMVAACDSGPTSGDVTALTEGRQSLPSSTSTPTPTNSTTTELTASSTPEPGIDHPPDVFLVSFDGGLMRLTDVAGSQPNIIADDVRSDSVAMYDDTAVSDAGTFRLQPRDVSPDTGVSGQKCDGRAVIGPVDPGFATALALFSDGERVYGFDHCDGRSLVMSHGMSIAVPVPVPAAPALWVGRGASATWVAVGDHDRWLGAGSEAFEEDRVAWRVFAVESEHAAELTPQCPAGTPGTALFRPALDRDALVWVFECPDEGQRCIATTRRETTPDQTCYLTDLLGGGEADACDGFVALALSGFLHRDDLSYAMRVELWSLTVGQRWSVDGLPVNKLWFEPERCGAAG